ncbi:MAG: hypothetical protein MSG64_11640 [Pyrinomonadaceae bacterium MAG19_C2-C3]|nr:hypothetical protein [Pyrinomonadaceae bacterium MAG19_C2-C3]
MNDLAKTRERFLRDDLPTRLGNLAANLARIGSFINNPVHHQVVNDLLTESKFFIEWTAAETETEVAAELVELQVQLACWQLRLANILDDSTQQARIAEQARRWSNRVLHVSGLMQAA